jgi:hypothetical protein
VAEKMPAARIRVPSVGYYHKAFPGLDIYRPQTFFARRQWEFRQYEFATILDLFDIYYAL